MLPLNALRVFDAAARWLSFTRAADELAVTPAAVGQQIRALEETLGVILFRRSAKGLELTPEAEAALPALRHGFLSLEETVAALRAGQGGQRLTIAVARPALRHWLAPRLEPWLALRPDTDLRLLPIDQPVDFREANLDLALSFGPAPDAEGVFGRVLADEQWADVMVAGAPERPIRWVGDGMPPPLADRPAPGLLAADAGDALDLALAGLGRARVPATLCSDAVAAGRLVETGPRSRCDASFWLCAPAPQWKSPKVRELVELLTGTGD
jgi:LysR family glycine cleavage system transcriptional activator